MRETEIATGNVTAPLAEIETSQPSLAVGLLVWVH